MAIVNRREDARPDRGADSSLLELRNYVNWIAFSLLPVTALYIYCSALSGSLSVAALTLQCGISIFANVFTLISMRSIVHKNVLVFPYGTGKLENFIGFLTGTLMLPVAAMIYISTVESFMSGKHDVRFGYTQIGMIPDVCRAIALMAWSKKLIRKSRSPSPIVRAFYVDYKVSVVIGIAGILSMLFALILTRMNYGRVGSMIDLSLAAILATYMVVNAAILITHNFRSLIDLPLAEKDQLKIMSVLTSHYDSYDNIGVIYTRRCGSTKIIEIELCFRKEITLEDIRRLSESFQADFDRLFPDFVFRLIPVTDSPSCTQDDPADLISEG